MRRILFLISILPVIMLAGCSEGENTLNGNGELPNPAWKSTKTIV